MRGYYALAMVFVALIVLILCLTVFFKTSTIEIDGVSLYTSEQILNVGGISNGANLVRTSTDNIENRLESTLVFLDEVKVTKKYPSTIVISCKEAIKAADIECDDTYYVLSQSGKILEAKNGRPTGEIPIIKGFELKSKDVGATLESDDTFKAKILLEILQEAEKLEFNKITQIDMTSRSDIKLDYDNRIEIRLGSSVDIGYKLNYFKTVIDEKLTSNFEGTLIYNGADSGISAIPKDSDTISKAESDTDSSAVDSSADSSIADYTDDNAYAADTQVTDTTGGYY